jgi:hypothetical protein
MILARTMTPGSIAFVVVTLLGVSATCLVLHKRVRNFWWKFLATASGVMIFEFFTAPMWRNEKLGQLGYLYHDVSWILTIGWTALILGAISLSNTLLPRSGEGRRYGLTLVLLLGLVMIAENVLVSLEIRRYAPEVWAVLSGPMIGYIPIESLYYVPVFTALVVAFSRYWAYVIDDAALVPVIRTRWLRALGLTCLGVFLFEIMVEPMVENLHLPAWSYLYRDVSLILTGVWVLIIAISAMVVQRFLQHRSIPERFVAVLLLISVFALPIESWLIANGYRVYGPSATMNFSGHKTWLTGAPIEVVFAIPLYMALIIGFVRYWEIVGDNNGLVLPTNDQPQSQVPTTQADGR